MEARLQNPRTGDTLRFKLASLRKSNMPPADMSRFLYTIIKQLDLKAVDWAQVAADNAVTNGHASRMRYSRFRQQMEGHIPSRRPRNPGAKRGPKPKVTKKEEEVVERKIKPEPNTSTSVSTHAGSFAGSMTEWSAAEASQLSIQTASTSESRVKSEPIDDNPSQQASLPTLDSPTAETSFSSQIPRACSNDNISFSTYDAISQIPEFNIDDSFSQMQYQHTPLMDFHYADNMLSQPQTSFIPDIGMYSSPMSMNEGGAFNSLKLQPEDWTESFTEA